MEGTITRDTGRGHRVREKLSESKVVMPCPFCGKMPEVFGSGEGQRGLMIHCITEGCVNPSVSYYQHDAAVRAWNRRA